MRRPVLALTAALALGSCSAVFADDCVDLPGEAGIAACRAAMALGPSARRAAVLRDVLAAKLAGLERWEEVVAVYREAARDPAPESQVLLRLGSALVHGVGRPEEALPWLREAARLAPADPDPWGVLGAALAALGRGAEAAAACARTLETMAGLEPVPA